MPDLTLTDAALLAVLFVALASMLYLAHRMQGQRGGHSARLYPEDAAAARELLAWSHPPFVVPDAVLSAWRAAGRRSDGEHAAWLQRVAALPADERAEFERVIKDQADDATFKAAADTVRETILGQLNTTGRFRNEVHESYAAFASQWYAVTAAKMGITPDALFQQFPLKVVAEDVVGDRLDQGAVETPEFRAWFGDSKVVDAEGKPLVVYHGTQSDISTFDPNAPGKFDVGWLGRGNYFTDSTGTANYYAGHRAAGQVGENVMPVYLSLRSPLILTANMDKTKTQAMAEALGVEFSGWNAKTADEAEALRDAAMAQGYDGVIYQYNHGQKQREYVVFSPVQIKSAIGNRGTFDPDDPNILHQGTHNRGAFSPASNTIALLKEADLTKFLHETAHFFLEVQADITGRTDAPAAIQQDMQTLLDWFGVKDLAEWTALPFEEKRAHHEKWAEGFEKYLFEGRAPSLEMQGLFQRFRAWMLNVYKTLKAMRVDLTDEVRGVMDRMLATTEQIKTAELARSMMPLFQTAEDAAKVGLDAAEFRALHDQAMEATQAAISDLETRGLRDMKWLAGARGRELKRLQREAKAQRAEVQIEARREVMSQPVYRAWAFLTGKPGQKTDSRIAYEEVLAAGTRTAPTLNRRRANRCARRSSPRTLAPKGWRAGSCWRRTSDRWKSTFSRRCSTGTEPTRGLRRQPRRARARRLAAIRLAAST